MKIASDQIRIGTAKLLLESAYRELEVSRKLLNKLSIPCYTAEYEWKENLRSVEDYTDELLAYAKTLPQYKKLVELTKAPK